MLSRVTRVRKISMHGIILTLQSRSVQIIAEHLNVTNIRSKERRGYQNKDITNTKVKQINNSGQMGARPIVLSPIWLPS